MSDISEFHLTTSLAGALGVKHDGSSGFQALLEHTNAYMPPLPFNWLRMRPCLERMPVAYNILFPGKNKRYLSKMLSEFPEKALLISDVNFSGKKALWVAAMSENIDFPKRWIGNLAWPVLVTNYDQGEVLVAAPLWALLT